MKNLLITTIILCFSVALSGQESGESADTLRKDALNVYFEASEFIKKEISFINYVREIREADLYIIETFQRTGSGGHEVTYFLTGQKAFTGMKDTIRVNIGPDETEDTGRNKQVNALKLGLMRYVRKTPLAQYMKISFTAPVTSDVATDKWNSWVFRSGVNGFVSGEKTYNQYNISTNLSASKVTDLFKYRFSLNYSQRESKYDLGDTILYSPSNSKGASSTMVYSLNDHWSVGASLYANASTYGNYDLELNVMPGIEYNIFPYSESTRRQLRILYKVGYGYADYIDTTEYFLMKEHLWQQDLSISYEVVEKWGEISTSAQVGNYLNHWNQYYMSLDGYISVRVAKGLNFNVGGGGSIIYNQRNITKGEDTVEEVLTRRSEQRTNYRLFSHFGFTYTFGSIYNNVVNPRFGSGGGGGMTIIMN